MPIPREKIDEIRDATDIVEYIGGFVKLRKRGKNYVGLCPFHQEKTPSFNVSADRQMYHCFGCGVGGNVFTFIMEREKVPFVEAVRMLAARAGIAIPAEGGDGRASEQEQLFQVLRAAGLYYYRALTETPEGKLALDYFHERGFSDETIRIFGLGYSPRSWESLAKHLAAEKFTPDQMARAGLVKKRDDGTWYDTFRGRAMFPIFSASGKIIGFGARKLHEDDPLAKYINSPETPVYNKSQVLYGISHAKESIREQEEAILVEGYADLISVFQSGVRNVVASSGTALTREQVQLVKRYATRLTIVYDADSAGAKAALRGVEVILQEDVDVRVAELPAGEDPDSFVRKNGPGPFRKLVGEAETFVDFLAAAYKRQQNFSTPEGQAQSVRAIVSTIAKMPDALKRSFYIKQVAEKYKLYESTLYQELDRLLPGAKRTGAADIPLVGRAHAAVPEAPSAIERDLLHAMLEGGGEVVAFVFNELEISEFRHPQSKELAAILLQMTEDGMPIEPASLVASLPDARLQRLVADILFSRHQPSSRWDEHLPVTEAVAPMRTAQDALLSLRKRRLEESINVNQQAMREELKRGGDAGKYLELHRKLLEQLKAIEKPA